jgi:hypothetical protein
MLRARDWALDQLTHLGFVNVRAEPFKMTAWSRGEESASVVAPYPHRLHVLGIGGTVATPPEGVEADIVLFRRYQSLLDAPAGSISGKIAVVTEPMEPDLHGYEALIAARAHGASEAAKRGAIGYLMRSLTAAKEGPAHTGGLNYAAGTPRIPAGALSVADADLLERLAGRGKPVRVRINMQSGLRQAESWNVVGEIQGTTDEVVLVGAHLDSWDVGTGANDDGAGVATAISAARLAGDRRPRRTLRVVLFGAEEVLLSGPAYLEYNKPDLNKILLASEADLGSQSVTSVALPAAMAGSPIIATLSDLLAPLGVTVSRESAADGGTDVAPMNRAGVLPLSVTQPADRYFRWHHSVDDTLDKVDPRELQQNVAVWTVLLNVLGNAELELPTTERTTN